MLFPSHFSLSLQWILFRPFWLSSKQKSGKQTAVMMSLYGMDFVHSSIKMQRTMALSIVEFITCCNVDDVFRYFVAFLQASLLYYQARAFIADGLSFEISNQSNKIYYWHIIDCKSSFFIQSMSCGIQQAFNGAR